MTNYAQIKARIAKLEKEAEQMLRKEAVKAIETIKTMMEKYQITLADLRDSLSDGRRTPKTVANKLSAKARAVKYQNPKTGESWSGLGRRPAWIQDAIAEGKLEKFLVGSDDTKPAKSSTAAKKPRAKVASKASTKASATPRKATKAAASKGRATKPGRKTGTNAAAKTRGRRKSTGAAPTVSEGVASAAAE